MSILLLIAGFTIFQAVFADRIVEPFSELGVLGPNMRLGDYPRELVTGEEFDLYLYLGNHEGRVMYYRVALKLGDQSMNVSDTEALNVPVFRFYDQVLQDQMNATLPLSLSLNEAGDNIRLVFELHRYDSEARDFIYHSWIQLWFNVTAPN